jgi:uncharacterized membrane protein YfcA
MHHTNSPNQVSSASSSVAVLFSSSAALVGFALLGRINVPYSLVLGGASMAASVLGVVAVSDLVGDLVALSSAEGIRR